jgi:hypothetical protein
MQEKISVQGLAQFQRALKKLDSDLPKLVRTANNDAANVLIQKAQPLIPARTGRARGSLKARSTRTSARISIGGNKAPYVPWLDFGGKTGRKKSVVRPFIKEGRYIYPTLAKYRDEIAEKQYESLADVARQAGLEVE